MKIWMQESEIIAEFGEAGPPVLSLNHTIVHADKAGFELACLCAGCPLAFPGLDWALSFVGKSGESFITEFDVISTWKQADSEPAALQVWENLPFYDGLSFAIPSDISECQYKSFLESPEMEKWFDVGGSIKRKEVWNIVALTAVRFGFCAAPLSESHGAKILLCGDRVNEATNVEG